MYKKGYGIIETQAPLHIGATAGEESGNLNLIFRDLFTNTGIVPGSSLRGRLRSEMRLQRIEWEEDNPRQNLPPEIAKKRSQVKDWQEKNPGKKEKAMPEGIAKANSEVAKWEKENPREDIPRHKNENLWYGSEAVVGKADSTTESLVKLEHASIVWLPVFCPGQPIVWVSCPRLLRRYQKMAGSFVKFEKKGEEKLLKDAKLPEEYTSSKKLNAPDIDGQKTLFFNLGYVEIKKSKNLSPWFPNQKELPALVVGDKEIAMIHDMALYRQSRVALDKKEKKVAGSAFFNTEALPEDTILAFPFALKESDWQPFPEGSMNDEIYLGGLESIGFGRCSLTIFK